jgi:hypothetical protein
MHALLIDAPQPHDLYLYGILFQLEPSAFKICIDFPVVLPGALPPILDQHLIY